MTSPLRHKLMAMGCLALPTLLTNGTALADQAALQPPPPCQGKVWWAESDAAYSDFDFWVGEWQVYERATDVLMGFDQITKAFNGCALSQHWRQMHDRYAAPGSTLRLQGGSHTALGADGRWHQTWIGNDGSNIPLSGGLNKDGVMVLESDWIEFTNRQGQAVKYRNRWHWAPQEDGSIHNWGQAQSGNPDKPEWVTVYDIVYRRNSTGGPTAQLSTEED